jgi:hypothetical protein
VTTVHVEFSGADRTAIVAVFAGAQDLADHPHYAEISDTDPRYLDFALPLSSLEGVRRAQIAHFGDKCRGQIYAGFVSSALGAPHTYPAKDKDQANLTASVVSSLLPGRDATWSTPFWCADAAGAWAMRPHTAAQIQRVGDDAKAAILTAIAKNEQRSLEVLAAGSVAAVKAVVW